jgi:hypothetical protein
MTTPIFREMTGKGWTKFFGWNSRYLRNISATVKFDMGLLTLFVL